MTEAGYENALCMEAFALRQKPAKFRDLEDVLAWIPLHLGAIAFDALPLIDQARNITLIAGEIRNFEPVGYESKEWGRRPVHGLCLERDEDGRLVLYPSRRVGCKIFRSSVKLTA